MNNNTPVPPLLPSIGLHTALPYFQQPYWLQTQQQQALLAAAVQSQQSQQWQDMANWAPPQQSDSINGTNTSLNRRPHSAAVTAQETAAAAALRRSAHGRGDGAGNGRNAKPRRTKHLSTPSTNETSHAVPETEKNQHHQSDTADEAARALRADISTRPWSANVSPAELKQKTRQDIQRGRGMGNTDALSGIALDAVASGRASSLEPVQRQRRPQTADVHRPQA